MGDEAIRLRTKQQLLSKQTSIWYPKQKNPNWKCYGQVLHTDSPGESSDTYEFCVEAASKKSELVMSSQSHDLIMYIRELICRSKYSFKNKTQRSTFIGSFEPGLRAGGSSSLSLQFPKNHNLNAIFSQWIGKPVKWNALRKGSWESVPLPGWLQMDFLGLVQCSTLRSPDIHISRIDTRFPFPSLLGPQKGYGKLEAVLTEFQEFSLHIYCCRENENNNHLLQHDFVGKEFGRVWMLIFLPCKLSWGVIGKWWIDGSETKTDSLTFLVLWGWRMVKSVIHLGMPLGASVLSGPRRVWLVIYMTAQESQRDNSKWELKAVHLSGFHSGNSCLSISQCHSELLANSLWVT